MTTDTQDLTATVDAHLAAYAEPDAAKRGTLIAQAWAPEGRLVDPPLVGEGHDGIGQAAAALLTQFPGHTFRRTSGVDAHHGHFRYGWELVGPDGQVAVAGTDVGLTADDGRLAHVVGFFGELPTRA